MREQVFSNWEIDFFPVNNFFLQICKKMNLTNYWNLKYARSFPLGLAGTRLILHPEVWGSSPDRNYFQYKWNWNFSVKSNCLLSFVYPRFGGSVASSRIVDKSIHFGGLFFVFFFFFRVLLFSMFVVLQVVPNNDSLLCEIYQQKVLIGCFFWKSSMLFPIHLCRATSRIFLCCKQI